MLCPDVNILLYAFRRDSDEHSSYAQWLQLIMRRPIRGQLPTKPFQFDM
jgi:predicted nucleic acid-binding protein